jgi:hypothetical protein
MAGRFLPPHHLQPVLGSCSEIRITTPAGSPPIQGHPPYWITIFQDHCSQGSACFLQGWHKDMAKGKDVKGSQQKIYWGPLVINSLV